MKFKRWNIAAADQEHLAALREAGYPYLLSLVLSSRGVGSPEEAAEILDRERSLNLSPMLMKDMDKAVDRLHQAIIQGEKILIYGDYDVDGVTSVSMLYLYLESKGGIVSYYIPDILHFQEANDFPNNKSFHQIIPYRK